MNLEPLVYVSDLKKSVDFYVKILGFQLGELYPDKNEPTYAPIFIDAHKLMLVLARDDNTKFHKQGLGGSGVQLFIQVMDVDDRWNLVRYKVDIVDKIETKNWGDREFTIKDPDGYLITFYTSSE